MIRAAAPVAILAAALTLAPPQGASGQDRFEQPGQPTYGLQADRSIIADFEAVAGWTLGTFLDRLSVRAEGRYPPQALRLMIFDSNGEVYRDFLSEPFEMEEGIALGGDYAPRDEFLPGDMLMPGEVVVPPGLELSAEFFFGPTEPDPFILVEEIGFVTPGFGDLVERQQATVEELGTFEEMWHPEAEWVAMMAVLVPADEEAWEAMGEEFTTRPVVVLLGPRRW